MEQPKINKNTVGVFVIMNSEFTNYFLKHAIKNINDVIEYTNHNTIYKITEINFVISQKDKERFFSLKELPAEFYDGIRPKILYKKEETISEIFNSLRSNVSDIDYISFYSANSLWIKNHIEKSIEAINREKREWSVSFAEIRNDITNKNPMLLNYKEPNVVNHLVNDVIIGEIVIKANRYKDIDFNRAKIKEGDSEYFYPGYAIKAYLKEYAICDKTTLRYYMQFLNEEELHYIPMDYKFDTSLIQDDDKEKIVFSVIINMTNTHNHARFVDILNCLNSQQFPLKNVELLIISNYNSSALFITQDEINKNFPNNRIIFVPNHIQDEYGTIREVAFNAGLQNSVGEIITYLDSSEGFLYSSAYLSELYVSYKILQKDTKWVLSNYYNVVNYIPVHSNVKVLNRNQMFFSMFSHKKDTPMQYTPIKAVDKFFSNNNLSLINIINYYGQQNIKGYINPKALIQKN